MKSSSTIYPFMLFISIVISHTASLLFAQPLENTIVEKTKNDIVPLPLAPKCFEPENLLVTLSNCSDTMKRDAKDIKGQWLNYGDYYNATTAEIFVRRYDSEILKNTPTDSEFHVGVIKYYKDKDTIDQLIFSISEGKSELSKLRIIIDSIYLNTNENISAWLLYDNIHRNLQNFYRDLSDMRSELIKQNFNILETYNSVGDKIILTPNLDIPEIMIPKKWMINMSKDDLLFLERWSYDNEIDKEIKSEHPNSRESIYFPFTRLSDDIISWEDFIKPIKQAIIIEDIQNKYEFFWGLPRDIVETQFRLEHLESFEMITKTKNIPATEKLRIEQVVRHKKAIEYAKSFIKKTGITHTWKDRYIKQCNYFAHDYPKLANKALPKLYAIIASLPGSK